MNDNCLNSLVQGLHAAVDGNLTVPAEAVIKPIETKSDDPTLAALVEVFNSMLGKAHWALEGYNAFRE